MGITKTQHYTDKQNEVSLLFKALGHPARLAIVEHLLKVNSCICSSIVDELPLAQATISQHLSAMKQAGLIVGSIQGSAIFYCLNPAIFTKIKVYLEVVNAKMIESNYC